MLCIFSETVQGTQTFTFKSLHSIIHCSFVLVPQDMVNFTELQPS